MAQHLPTIKVIFRGTHTELDNAHAALEDALSCLRSDWQPVGTTLTDDQADRRTKIRRHVVKALQEIEEARRYA